MGAISISSDLVVARFREDLGWLKRIPKSFRVTVYDKESDLPNIGREAHTYLHHIVTRYDNLAPMTVFCQGKPFDHASDFHKVLRTLNVEDFQWFGHIIDRDDRTGSLLFQKWSKNSAGHPLQIERFFELVFAETAPEFVTFYPGANFAVTAGRIKMRTLDFYRHALDVSANFPDAAHCFERCWDRVFGVNGIPPEWRTATPPIYLKPIRKLMREISG